MSQQPYARTSSYVAGFGLSLVCTLAAYGLVVSHNLSKWTLAALVAGFALAQFIVQLLLFLHLGREARPRWKLVVFGLMLLIVAILVLGSLWIMYSLNYTMMSPGAMNRYLQDQVQNGL